MDICCARSRRRHVDDRCFARRRSRRGLSRSRQISPPVAWTYSRLTVFSGCLIVASAMRTLPRSSQSFWSLSILVHERIVTPASVARPTSSVEGVAHPCWDATAHSPVNALQQRTLTDAYGSEYRNVPMGQGEWSAPPSSHTRLIRALTMPALSLRGNLFFFIEADRCTTPPGDDIVPRD